jgi:hypothetical protein
MAADVHRCTLHLHALQHPKATPASHHIVSEQLQGTKELAVEERVVDQYLSGRFLKKSMV